MQHISRSTGVGDHSRCWWCAVLFCLTAEPMWAQSVIQDLATTDDGSDLYFSSSLVLRGTGEYDSYKIFRYSGGQFTLVAQVPGTVSTPGGTDTFFFALRTPQVSGDGRVFTYDGTATCTGRVLCPGSFTVRGTIVGATLPPVGIIGFYGSLRVSRGGRYVLWFGGTWYG